MSKLSSYLTNKLEAWIEMEGFDGFEVKVAYLSRDELNKIRTSVTRVSWSPKTRQKEENIDSDLFMREFVKACVLDWKGLNLKHASRLLPLQIPEGTDMEEEIPFTQEDAISLSANSNIFDTWLNDVIFDLANFQGQGN
jgi:hypothetical protein